MNKLYYTLLITLGILAFSQLTSAQNVADAVRGKIVLQVQQNGEAWYIHPQTRERLYLGRPHDAFDIMRNQGIGITHENLDRIPIAFANYSNGPDADGDGLSNDFENAYYLNPNESDTDGDGFNDATELKDGFNPFGEGTLFNDTSYSQQHIGKIFIDVSNNGEAWYVNPADAKRYFLGRPHDAFEVMRSTGLGISDRDIETITIDETSMLPPRAVQNELSKNLSDLVFTEDENLRSVYLEGAFVDCGTITLETNQFTTGELEKQEQELEERLTCIEVRSKECLPTFARIEVHVDDDLFNEAFAEFGFQTNELFEIDIEADYEIFGRNNFDECEETVRVDEGRMLIVDQLFSFSNTDMICKQEPDPIGFISELDFTSDGEDTCVGTLNDYFDDHEDRLNSALERLFVNIFLDATQQ